MNKTKLNLISSNGQSDDLFTSAIWYWCANFIFIQIFMSWSGGPGTCTCLHSVWGAHCCLLCCGATAESVKRKTTCPQITIVRKQSLPTDIGSHHRIELDWQRRNKSSACKRQYSLCQLSTICSEHLNQEPKYENRLSLLQKHQLIQINGWLISYFKSNIFIHSFICISKIQYELDNI